MACEKFSGLGSSKMEISEPDFFDIVTNHNDEISYVMHVVDLHCVFFTVFGCWGGGGGGYQGGCGTTCLCTFPASAAQKWKFPNLIFLPFWPSKMMNYPM